MDYYALLLKNTGAITELNKYDVDKKVESYLTVNL